MRVDIQRLAINIDSPLILSTAPNFRPSTWPPPSNFPVVVERSGRVASRYGDFTWDFSPWAGMPLIVNFGDGPQRKGVPHITPENAELMRQIAAWLLWGPRASRSAVSLHTQLKLLRIIFILCSKEGITADNLSKFPLVADKIPSAVPSSHANGLLALLHSLLAQQDQLGFCLLDRAGLRRLEAAMPKHGTQQTPYMPPRIWLYQVNRLRLFLEEFHQNRSQLDACYMFCLDAYAKHFGSLADACRRRRTARSPFTISKDRRGVYPAGFRGVAEQFGIADLLARWCLRSDRRRVELSVDALSSYFTMAIRVGIAYLLNFSMMRIQEGWSLRANCLEIEQDKSIGPIYLLRGPTTKTIEDDDARWVASPRVKVAVDVLACVARLRVIAAQANPEVPCTQEDIRNPFLASRPYEPWARAKNLSQPHSVRSIYPSYQSIIDYHPALFDVKELRINERDLELARLITPSLDSRKFAVGKIWPLAWHQLRRTGAVNLQASGLVSDSSVQYQLKHATLAMSLYYGQGYSRVRLNESVRAEYVRTMYEVVSMEIGRLFGDRFVSAYGPERKSEILRMVSDTDHKQLLASAKAGNVCWRETLLGGCTKRGPCPYGGIDNVARCGGGDGHAPCADALFDKEREPAIRQLDVILADRMNEAPEGSPYRESLAAQRRAVENALNVLAHK